MLLQQTLIASILAILLPIFSFGQTSKSEKQLRNYLLQLKNSKVDTFLIIKSGCVGCEVKHTDTEIAVTDGQDIYVLSKQMGQFTIISFDVFGRQSTYIIDTCSLFDTIVYNKSLLQQKDGYYKKISRENKKGQFLPPRPTHYSYNDLAVKVSEFSYEYNVVENDSGMFVFPERQEKWFAVTIKIIDDFFSFLKSIRP